MADFPGQLPNDEEALCAGRTRAALGIFLLVCFPHGKARAGRLLRFHRHEQLQRLKHLAVHFLKSGRLRLQG